MFSYKIAIIALRTV